jgi:hypothetical protein
MAGDEGLLLVFVFAPIVSTNVETLSELAIIINGRPKSFGIFLSYFVGSKCASFAEKPKVFFFLDPNAERISTDGTFVSLE